MRALPFAILIGLAGCAEFPQLDAATGQVDPNAPFPALVPLGPLIAQGAATGRISLESETAGSASAEDLRARAARLRGPVVDQATRAQMADAARRAALR